MSKKLLLGVPKKQSMIGFKPASVLFSSKTLPPTGSQTSRKAIPTSKSSLSESNISLLMKSEQMNAKYVRITLKSNWGNPNRIALSSIIIFSENFQRVPILYSSILPITEAHPPLSNLFNGNLVNSKPGESWSIPWNSECNDPIAIVAIVPSESDIKFLRIWNDKFDETACVKDILIKTSDGLSYQGEMPLGFGLDIHLSQKLAPSPSTKIIAELFPHLQSKNGFSDKHGKCPIIHVKTIRVEILANFNKDQNIGLNAISLYDGFSNQIIWEEIEDVFLKNCASKSDPKDLFRPKKAIVKISNAKPYLMKTDWFGNPAIEIKLLNPTQITKMEIWNYNSLEMDTQIGVKNAKVYINDQLFWCGGFSKGNGSIKNIKKTLTKVWLTDVPELRNEFASSY